MSASKGSKRRKLDSSSSQPDCHTAPEPTTPKKVKKIKISGWSTHDYHTLLEKVEGKIPPDDKLKFLTRVHKLDWDEIAFNDYSSTECKKTWSFLMRKVRKYRTLKEIASDIRFVINDNAIMAKNHPEYPRRPLNAFIIMYRLKRPELLKQFPHASNFDISNKCAEIYRNLSQKELDKYQKLAREDKEETDRQVDEFYRNHPEFTRETKETRKERKSLDERKPRKPYQIFLDYEQANDQNAEEDTVAKIWSEMPDEDKLFWIDWAEEEFEKYKEIHKEARNVVLSKSEKEIKARLSSKPQKPPASSFHLFVKMMSKSDEFKMLNSRDRIGTIANIWKTNTEEEKEQYRLRIKQMWTDYHEALDEYAKTLSPEKKVKEWSKSLMKKPLTKKQQRKIKIKLRTKRRTKKDVQVQKPKTPPSSALSYFLKNYRGSKHPRVAWKKLPKAEKAKIVEDWGKMKREFVKNYEIYLRSLSKTQLEDLAKTGNVLSSASEDEDYSSED